MYYTYLFKKNINSKMMFHNKFFKYASSLTTDYVRNVPNFK